MSQQLQFTTTVLLGGQIQLPAGAANAGETVEVTVIPKAQPTPRPTTDILEFLDSLPPGPRSCATWEEFEEEFCKEREAWDR
jgi:hypothetical protein